jgi:hypothetical protein
MAPQRWKVMRRAEWDCGEQELLLVRRFHLERARRRIESWNRQLGARGEPDPFPVLKLMTETGAISAVARSVRQ